MKKVINTIVASGGGVKGLAYIGVFRKFEELIEERKKLENMENFKESECKIPKIDIKKFCCVSIGSIMCLLYIIGFKYEEIKQEILNKDFTDLRDVRLKNFINKYGLDSGKNIINWLEILMAKREYPKDITFDQLYKKTGVHYQVLATNLNKYDCTIFDYKNTPRVKVLSAIRMSISIPFVFSVKKYKGDIHVDGGIINNYPIKLFENEMSTVLGIKLINKADIENIKEEIMDINSYIYNVMSCFIVQKEKATTLFDEYINHTICIKADHITHMINFELKNEEKINLIDQGYISSNTYFNFC